MVKSVSLDGIESSFINESLITLNAVILFIPSVCYHVPIDVIFLWESFITLFALIWFFTSVFSHMTTEVIFHWKDFITMSALGSFPCISCYNWDYISLRIIFYIACIDMVSHPCSQAIIEDIFFCKKELSHWNHWYGFPKCVSSFGNWGNFYQRKVYHIPCIEMAVRTTTGDLSRKPTQPNEGRTQHIRMKGVL